MDNGYPHLEDVAEYHGRPSPHFVFSGPAWENVKATLSTARDDTSISGQAGGLLGTPVYLDECPWGCRD